MLPELLCQRAILSELEKERTPNHEDDKDIDVPPMLVTAQGTKTSTNTPPPKFRKRKRNLDIERKKGPPIASWIGKQILNQQIPVRQQSYLISSLEGYPEGLLAMKLEGSDNARIIVPVEYQQQLVLDTHIDIHHQGHQKVHHILYPLYYWPSMDEDIEKWCSACKICNRAKMRRKHLHSEFNALSGSHLGLPRQHYGFDFYGMPKGEILVIVDLCTRETIFKFVSNRT